MPICLLTSAKTSSKPFTKVMQTDAVVVEPTHPKTSSYAPGMSTSNLVGNDTLIKCFTTTKIKCTLILGKMDGGHLEFDLSWSSEVNFNFPPHLKLILMVCTNYVRSFMLFFKKCTI